MNSKEQNSNNIPLLDLNNPQEFNQQDQQNQMVDQVDQEQQIEEKPQHRYVVSFFESMYYFEDKFKQFSGIYYIFLSILFGFICFNVSKGIHPELPLVEWLFVGFFISFLFNYYLVRLGNIAPFLEDEDENYDAKFSGFCGLLSIVCIIYCTTTLACHIGTIIWLCSWMIALFLEKKYFSQARITLTDVIFCLTSVVGSTITIVTTNKKIYLEPTATMADKNNFYGGIIAALISSVCTGYTAFTFKKLQKTNLLTMNHIFCLIILLFLPVFFPMQQLVSPTIGMWIFMLILGVVIQVILYFFIRGTQLERPFVVLTYLNLFIVGKTAMDFYYGIYHSFITYVGTALILMSCVYFLNDVSEENIYEVNQNDEKVESQSLYGLSMYQKYSVLYRSSNYKQSMYQKHSILKKQSMIKKPQQNDQEMTSLPQNQQK